MAVSISDLIPRVRDLLDDEPWETTNSSDPGAGGTTFTVPDGTRFEEGDVVEFQDNGEQVRVASVSGNTLTVKRGHNGTTAAAHSSGTVILKNPIYGYRQISQALTWAVQQLWPYAWKVVTVSVTPSTTTIWYDADATGLALINATQRYGASNEHEGFYGRPGTNKPVVFEQNMDTGLVASGKGLRFPRGFYHPTNAVTVRLAAAITGTSDIEDSTTLPVADAVIFGACYRLTLGKQILRGSKAPNLEEAASVGESARLRTALFTREEFDRMLQSLRLRHQDVYPIAGRWER